MVKDITNTCGTQQNMAKSNLYKSPSLQDPHSPSIETLSEFHMPGLHTRRPDTQRLECSSQDSYHYDPFQPQPREQEPSYPRNNELPPAFWDSLSEIPLTRNALKELDRRNLADQSSTLESTAMTSAPAAKDGARTNNTPKSSSSPYCSAFKQHLIDHNIYTDSYIYPNGNEPPEPKNFDEIEQRLINRRPSVEKIGKTNHKTFTRMEKQATQEDEPLSTAILTIQGKSEDGQCVSGKKRFNNLVRITSVRLVDGNPDLYYGARPDQLNRQIRNDLNGFIIPSKDTSLPIIPNFFLAKKGPGGNIGVAIRQACYDGALGARAMYELRMHGRAIRIYDNNAYTITSTYVGGTLRLYAIHLGEPNKITEGRPEYFMTLLDGFDLMGNVESFKNGLNAFRNAKDWAQEQRDAAIKRANAVVERDVEVLVDSQQEVTMSQATQSSSGSSEDELAKR